MHLIATLCLIGALSGDPKSCVEETLVLNGPSDTPQTCLIKGQEALSDLIRSHYPNYRVTKYGCKRS